MAVAVLALTVSTAWADFVVDFDVTGIESWDLIFDSDNEVHAFDLAAAAGLPSGTPMTMTGIGWTDVRIATVGSSWLSEAVAYFDDNIAPDSAGLHLRPGVGDTFSGDETYSTGGAILDLTDNGLSDIALPNGVLRIEFYEDFDDTPNAVDANWVSGALHIQAIPEPATALLLMLGALPLLRRRT